MKLTQIAISTILGLNTIAGLASGAEAAKFQKYKVGVCGPIAECTIDFGVVPAGKTLEITDASCYLRATEDAHFYAMQLLVMKGAKKTSALTMGPLSFTTSRVTPNEVNVIHQVNTPVYAFAKGGQRFVAYAEIRGGEYRQFDCHISGQMTP